MQANNFESGVQLFSRLTSHQRSHNLNGINSKLFKEEGPLPNQIIEITGDFSKDLLVDFLVRCILPKEFHENWKGSEVVFINCSHHISILKITNIMNSYLKHLQIKNRKTIIEKALSLITILNCYSEEELQLTFKNLEKLIQDKDNVNLLIVDDITSQYWIAKQRNPKLSLEHYSKINFQILQTVVKNLNLVLIFSRQQLGNLRKSLDFHVDYKIIGEKVNTGQNQFTVMDYVKETTFVVPFSLQTFIIFL